ANEELYPDCDYVTRLDFMAKFTCFKVKGKLTDSIFNKMLEFFQHVFPTIKGYKLPPSYYEIKKTFKTIGLGESIHACVNDFFLFRGDNNKDVHFCPVCKTSRWKDSNTLGKKVPKKVLRYFLIIPRLQSLYKSSHTAKEMTWHATRKCMESYVHSYRWVRIQLQAQKALEGGPIRPRWMFPFERFVKKLKDNDLGVSTTSELFALACGPTPTPISVNSCVVNGVRFVVHSRDERHTTQNSGICSPGGKDREMYYGQLQEILVFRICRSKLCCSELSGLTLATKEVDASSNIIDLDEDDDIIDDEDALPNNLADSDDEDLVNIDDDDDGVDMSADVARGHGDDGGGNDRPPTHHIPTGCGGCFVNRGRGTRKLNLGGRKAGRQHTRQETRNLGLKITDDKGLVLIRFEWDDKKTLMPLGDHVSHWSNYRGELIREMPLYYPSSQKVPAERKATIVTKIEFDLKPHMQSL
nr:hypothetical protein [Tanacetum cinerariifolium]